MRSLKVEWSKLWPKLLTLLLWTAGASAFLVIGAFLFLGWAIQHAPTDLTPIPQPPSNRLGFSMPEPPGMFVLQTHDLPVRDVWGSGWCGHGRFAVHGEPGHVMRALGKQFRDEQNESTWVQIESGPVEAHRWPDQLLFRRDGKRWVMWNDRRSIHAVAFKYKELTVVDAFMYQDGPG